MNRRAGLEEEVLPDSYRSKISACGDLPATAGTFTLRRSHYFNVARTHEGLLLSHTGIAISLENVSHNHQRPFDNVAHKHWRT